MEGLILQIKDLSPFPERLASHTYISMIRPDATAPEIKEIITRAARYPFAGITVDLAYTDLAVKILADCPMNVVTTIACPLGGLTGAVKLKHAQMALEKGTDEIDVGMNLGAFRSGDHAAIKEEVAALVKLAEGKTVKIVICCDRLTNEEIVGACKMIRNGGANYVKTSPGFGAVTALEDVQLIRKHFKGEELKVAASGCISTRLQILDFLAAGADCVVSDLPHCILEAVLPEYSEQGGGLCESID